MLSISRALARQFRAVARRAGFQKPGTRIPACVRLIATADTLRLQILNGQVAIERRIAGQFEPADLTVPLQLFTDCEAKSEEQVSIRVDTNGQILAMWHERRVPQQRDYPAPPAVPEMPTVATALTANGPNLLVALRDAMATLEEDATRYALDCVQLRGATGVIAATDSRQLLVQSGFQFPWPGDLLMRGSGVFASREFSEPLPVEIGRTDTGVTVRIGEWTIHHEINRQGLYPQVDRSIPAPTAIQTRMQLDATDARFLAETLDRLPANGLLDRPVTVELNGAIVVRARKEAESPMTELLLSRSRRVGAQLLLQTNRDYLARALAMGFTEIGFVNAETPCVCQDATRTYVWSLLENQGALESHPDAIRIDSAAVPATAAEPGTKGAATRPARIAVASPTSASVAATSTVVTAVTPINRLAKRLRQSAMTEAARERELPAPVSRATDVIAQALALRDQLRTVAQGLTELVVQIRQQRKQSRLMKSTLQSLQQLQLLEA